VRRFAAILALAVAGCGLLPILPDPDRLPGVVVYPDGCDEYGFSQRRCDAIVLWARDQLPAGHAAIRAIELAPNPEPEAVRLGGSFTALVRFRLEDGTTQEFPLYCGLGGHWSILCTEKPEIRISSPTMGGYRDIPCAGEAPDGCATPLPTLEPAAADASRPLTIAARDITIDREGKFEISLGQAVLPNGILSEASFSLRDAFTQSLSVGDGVWLDIRPIEPGAPPFDNYYQRGWHEGTETVDAVLVFEVVSFEPGATLELRDIVVR
jgi:hypothetical protein